MDPFEEACFLLDHYDFIEQIREPELLALRQLLDVYLTIDDIEHAIATADRFRRGPQGLHNPDNPWRTIRSLALDHAEIANYEPFKDFQQEHQ